LIPWFFSAEGGFVGFLNNLFGGGAQKHEDKGDELRLDLMYQEAAHYYQKALDALKEEDPATQGRLETKLREVRRKAAAGLIEEAVELIQEEELGLALERLDRAEAFADDTAAQDDIHRHMAEIHDLRGESLPAVETDVPEEVAGTDEDLFELALSGLAPEDREHARNLGEPFRNGYEACQREAWDDSLEHFEKILAADPDDALILELSAVAEEHRGNLEPARDLYRRARAADADRPGTVQGLVAVLRALDDKDGAKAVLAESVAGRPGDGSLTEMWLEIHVDHAMGHSQAGDHDEALDVLGSLTREPAMNQALLCFNMAGVLEAAERDEECRAALEKATELGPRVSVYHERLSDYLVKRRDDLDLALKLLVHANEVETTTAGGIFGGGGGKVSISPNRGRYLYKMARVYYLKGEDLEAERTISTALAVTEDPAVLGALEELREDLKEAKA